MIEVYQKLVSAYVRQGNMADARKFFDEVNNSFDIRLATDADDPFTRYYMACACAMMNEKERAFEHLEKAIAGKPNFNIAYSLINGYSEWARCSSRPP